MLRRFSFNKFSFKPSLCYVPTHYYQSNVSEFVRVAYYEENKKQEEEKNYKILMENLNRIHVFDQTSNAAKSYLTHNLLKVSINAKTPLKDILESYQSNNRFGFDEAILTMCIDYLARTYKSFSPSKISEDFNLTELQLNHRFCDMVEEIKFGLKEGVAFDHENIAKILSALMTLEYKNLDLQNMFFEKIFRSLRGDNAKFKIDMDDPFKNYQSFKKYYYQNIMDIDSIFKNPEFIQKFNAFLNLDSTNSKEEISVENNSLVQNQDIITALLENLNEMVSKNDTNFKKIIQSIMAIRAQYRKMRKVKESIVFLREDPNIKAIFLEIEEKLLNLEILNIEDIKIIDIEPEENEELSVVTKIFEEFLKKCYPQSLDFIPVLLNQKHSQNEIRENSTTNKIQILDFIKPENNELKLSGIAESLYYLSEIAQLPVYEAQKRDYIDNKWEKIFETSEIPAEVKHILEENNWVSRNSKSDKLFTPIYLHSLKAFKELFPEIQKVLQKDFSLKQIVYLSHAYSNMGFDEKSNVFLNLISKDLASQLSTFELNDFKVFLSMIVNGYGQNLNLKDHILQYVEKNHQEFDLETSSLSFLTLAMYEANESNVYSGLFNNFYSGLYGEKEINKLSLNLINTIYDVKMLLDAKILNIPSINEEMSKNLSKLFAGFQIMKIEFGDNIPQKNPVTNEFLQVLKKNMENESIHNELQSLDFHYLNKNYKPHLFTRKQEKTKEVFKRAMFLLDSNNNALENTNLKEIWRLRFKIIEKIYPNVKCSWIPSNLLFEINENRQEIKLKSQYEMNLILNNIIKNENQYSYYKKVKKFSKVLSELYEKKKFRFKNYKNNAILLKMVSNLSEIFALSKKVNFVGSESISLYYFEKIKVLIYLTSLATKFLDKKLKRILLKKVNKAFHAKYHSFIKFYQNIIKRMKKEIPISENMKKIPSLIKENQWIGKRLTNELIDPSELQKNKNINYEIIDLGFYNDHSYHQYPSWKKLFRNLTHNNLFFVNPSIYSNCLYNSNIENNASEMIGAIPLVDRMRNIIKPMSYKLNWEGEFYQKSENQLKKMEKYENLASQSQNKVDKSMEFIINLQNFKYTLKKQMKVDEIGQLLLDFKFIDELIQEHLNITPLNFEVYQRKLKRKGKDLLKYQNSPMRGSFVNNYTKFMMKVALRKDKFKSLLKIRNGFQIYKDYKEGKFDLKTLNLLKDKIDAEIYEEILKMKKSSSEGSIVSPESKKYMDYEVEIEEIMKNMNINNLKKENELDFIKCNGSFQNFLRREKRKAETKLIKMRLIKKIHENIPLSSNEQLYLKGWKNSTLPSKSLKVTKRSIRSLQETDKTLISKTNQASLSNCQDFPLSDFILEFSLFFNDKFLEDVNWRMKSTDMQYHWNIDTNLLFPVYQNSENSYILQRYENYLYNISGEFTQDETDLTVDMVKILKTHTKKDKKQIEIFEKSIRDFTQLVNPFHNRYNLFEKWISKKENELKDECYSNTSYKNQEIEMIEVWPKIFKKTYQETNSNDLHIFVNNLVERLHIFRKNSPKSLNTVLKYTLEHPQLSTVNREILLSFLEIFDIDINLDCKEIENYLLKIKPSEENLNEKNITEKLKNSSIPFMDTLFSKINNLIKE